MRSKLVYLALGSNLGDREHNLARAIEALIAAGIEVTQQSSIYETAPMLLLDQPRFLNQAVAVKTARFPRQLLDCIQAIERKLGRRRTVVNGPRVIDIDILLYGATVMDSMELTIPHPGIAERRFVLEPLSEIAPTLRHPVLKRTIRELLAATRTQDVKLFRASGTPRL